MSLNYQSKYDFDRSLRLRFRDLKPSGTLMQRFLSLYSFNVDYEQKGNLSALSPAFGFELTDRLSLGVAMNVWDSSLLANNEWETVTERRTFTRRAVDNLRLGTTSFRTIIAGNDTYEKYEDVEGTNYTFGVLYKPTQRLSLGAVYHTAYSTDVRYTKIDRYRNPFGAEVYRTKLRIEWPAAMGVGVAYRFPNDKLTLSLDVTRRNWDSFIQTDPRGGLFGSDQIGLSPITRSRRLGSTRISPITGMSKDRSPHDPTYTVRIGAEYVFVNPNKVRQTYLPSLRAGVFYDPEPASGREDTWWGVKQGDGDPDDYYGVALGTGVLIKNRVNIDLAYQYRWGTNVRKDTITNSNGRGPDLFERGFSVDVDQHLIYLSTVIYF